MRLNEDIVIWGMRRLLKADIYSISWDTRVGREYIYTRVCEYGGYTRAAKIIGNKQVNFLRIVSF